MDNAKIGHLILQLRKEKNLTQRDIAEQLHISNKTVSKWECGLGCPDVSLWEGLANLLGTDLLSLLQGKLSPNRPDIGKLERLRFYCCPVCGNILTSTGSASVSCCGRQLSALLPPRPRDTASPPRRSRTNIISCRNTKCGGSTTFYSPPSSAMTVSGCIGSTPSSPLPSVCPGCVRKAPFIFTVPNMG